MMKLVISRELVVKKVYSTSFSLTCVLSTIKVVSAIAYPYFTLGFRKK